MWWHCSPNVKLCWVLGARFQLLRLSSFLKYSHLWCSNCMVRSSENITLPKSSSTLKLFLTPHQFLSLVSSLISWQWCGLVHTHPNCLRWSLIVERETLSAGYFSINVLCSFLTVTSSFHSNSSFITIAISCVTFFSHFLWFKSVYSLVCWNFFIKRYKLCHAILTFSRCIYYFSIHSHAIFKIKANWKSSIIDARVAAWLCWKLGLVASRFSPVVIE